MPFSSLTPKIYRAHADECRGFANSAIDPRTRSHWLRLAKVWELTAAEDMLAESVAEFEKDGKRLRSA